MRGLNACPRGTRGEYSSVLGTTCSPRDLQTRRINYRGFLEKDTPAVESRQYSLAIAGKSLEPRSGVLERQGSSVNTNYARRKIQASGVEVKRFSIRGGMP